MKVVMAKEVDSKARELEKPSSEVASGHTSSSSLVLALWKLWQGMWEARGGGCSPGWLRSCRGTPWLCHTPWASHVEKDRQSPLGRIAKKTVQ